MRRRTFDFIASVNDRLFEGVGREEYRAVGNFHARFIGNTKATLDWIDRQAGGPERSRVSTSQDFTARCHSGKDS